MLEKIMESYQKVAPMVVGISLVVGLTSCGEPYYNNSSERSSSSDKSQRDYGGGEGYSSEGRKGYSRDKGGHWECPKK